MVVTPVLAWIERPNSRTGIRFATAEGWQPWSYRSLAAFARRVGGGLVAAGVGRDDRVLLVQHGGPEFVATLFGTMLAGAIPCPVAPPLLLQDPGRYAAHVAAVVAAARPSMLVTAPELSSRMAGLLAGGQAPPVVTVDELAGDPDVDRPLATSALVQFTSGSSGQARGVRVPFEALAANISAIRGWLAMTEGDPTASWLPVHHDMGLVGCLLAPVVNQSDLWLLTPEQFVRDPMRYLRCFGAGGAKLTAMPTFGLDHVLRRVAPEKLTGLDFSQWRAVIVGAERIDAGVLERFTGLLAPSGFERRAILPAYGLAEATVAVSGLDLRAEFTTAAVAASTPAIGDRVQAPDGAEEVRVVGCGAALPGVSVTVVDHADVPVPDGHLGEIVVRGRSVAGGYTEGGQAESRTRWQDGVLYTGDAGFLLDGQLFVIGRLGDSMKIRGRMLFAEDVEAALVAEGIPRTRLAVLLGASAGDQTVVALIEAAEDGWTDAAESVLRRMTERVTCVVADVARRSILRTTSGKPKRRAMWLDYLAGRFDPADKPS